MDYEYILILFNVLNLLYIFIQMEKSDSTYDIVTLSCADVESIGTGNLVWVWWFKDEVAVWCN